jgi:phage gp36-like protein
MPYAIAQDLKDRYPAKVLAELTDVNGVTINDAALDLALADASVEIDGFLVGRYALPLSDPPANLKLYACEIAFYRLMKGASQEAIKDAKDRYDSALRYLRSVSEGKTQLSLSADDQSAPQTDGPIIQGSKRVFDRDAMRGF